MPDRDYGAQGAVDCYQAGKSVHTIDPLAMCRCGHRRVAHYGLGSCLAQPVSKTTGKLLEGSVCPCGEFRPLPSAA